MPLTQPFNQACKNCRIAKSKCIKSNDSDGVGGGEKCRRCKGAGVECSLMPRAARKRRKRIDARISVLEGMVGELEELMERAKKEGNSVEGGFAVGGGKEDVSMMSGEIEERYDGSMALTSEMSTIFPLTPESATSSGQQRVSFEVADPFAAKIAAVEEHHEMGDVSYEVVALPGIVPDLLPLEEARRLLAKFRQETVQQFPLVLLSKSDTFEKLATTRPTLLLAILTAASTSSPGPIFKTLHAELTSRLAMKVIVSGESSLELVQALLVMEVWYCLSDDVCEGGGVNFYQWIHVAATMALQLGLGSSGGMEEVRILLGCWVSCSSVAVSLRRENMMKMTPALQENLGRFEQKAVKVEDKRLLAWVRLQMIAEEAQSVTPKQEYVRGSFLSRTEDLDSQVYCLQRQLEGWEKGLEAGILNETLMIHFLYTKAKVLEIPLHAYHDLSRLTAYPFLFTATHPTQQQIPSVLAPVYTRTAAPFLEACHSLLDTFASMPPGVLGGCPTVIFVRAIYAMSALKLVASGSVLAGDVGVRDRIEGIWAKVEGVLGEVVGGEGRQVPKAVLGVWRRIGGKERRTSDQNDNSQAIPTRDATRQEDMPASVQKSITLEIDQDQTFSIESDPSYNTGDFMPLSDYSCALMAQSTLEDDMMDTFLHGYAVADLITP